MNKFAQLGADIVKLWTKYGASYLSGIENTLILALVGTVIGCVIGFVCGVLNTIPTSPNDHPLKRFFLGLVRVIIRLYVEIFRGTPMVLQAVFLYYGLPYFSNNSVKFSSVWAAAIVVVSINTGAYMAESVRGGIISVDPGQTEGAKAIGMTQIGNNFIINVKDTSVMFIIGFPDFFSAHRAAVGASYLYFPSATVEMIGYLTMTLLASFLLRWMEKKMDGSSSYELVQTDQLTMTAGTYNYPDNHSPFDERNPEAVKSMQREKLRRQIEQDTAVREGRRIDQRRESRGSKHGGEN